MDIPKKLKRVPIKEELVTLTKSLYEAVILQQFLYWQERVKDFDRFVHEENERMKKHNISSDFQATSGWIYKKAEELVEETMLCISPQTLRKHLTSLVTKEYVLQRENPLYKWDKTLQYRVNFPKVINDLHKVGYLLDGYHYIDSSNLHFGVSKLENGGSENDNGDSEHETRGSNLQNGGAIPESTSNNTLDITLTTTKAFSFYQENFGVLNPFISQQIDCWIDDLNDELVVEAMKMSLKQQKNWKYAEGILKSWYRNNIRTIEDVQAFEAQFKRRTTKRINASIDMEQMSKKPDDLFSGDREYTDEELKTFDEELPY